MNFYSFLNNKQQINIYIIKKTKQKNMDTKKYTNFSMELQKKVFTLQFFTKVAYDFNNSYYV